MPALNVATGQVTGYRWDVFISYRRSGNVTSWVRNHLHPRLIDCLEDELPRRPRVFLDNRIEVGAYWPDGVADALRTARFLLAVWSPPYFTSRWCVAEWHTMRFREQCLGLPGPGEARGLIYPVVFSDGASFPFEARAVQTFDLTAYGFPDPQFSQTESYLAFHDKVKEIAKDLAERLDSAPLWQPDWPVFRPDPYPAPPPSFPTLGET